MIKKIAVFAFVISIIVFLLSVYIFQLINKPLEVKNLYASVNITEKIGFDLNSSSLVFGELTKGGSSRRSIIFNNNYNQKIVLKISSHGKIEKLISFEERILFLPGESKKISFVIFTNQDTPFGFYDGEIVLEVYPG